MSIYRQSICHIDISNRASPTTRLLLAFGDLVDVLVLLLLARLLYVLLLLNNPVQEGPKEVGGNDHHCCLDVDEQVND